MSKIVALMSGGDWNDASVEHLVISDETDLDSERELYEAWYHNNYCVRLERNNSIKFMTFSQWLIKKGARETTDEEVLEYWKD